MKLEEYLTKNDWNTAVFSRRSKVKLGVLRKIVNEAGSVNLNTALRIEAATKGEVKVWDLIAEAKDIAEEFSYPIEEVKKERDRARDKNRKNEK